MVYCPGCGGRIEEGGVFCQNCGAPIEEKIPVGTIPAKDFTSNFMSNIEHKVYFKVARVFAWSVAALCVIGLFISIVYVVKTVPQVLDRDAKVSLEEVREAIAHKEQGRRMEVGGLLLDPRLRGKLSTEIYKLVALLPEELQRTEPDIEALERNIRGLLAPWVDIEDKLSVAQEVRTIIENFPKDERINALGMFFVTKIKKEGMIEVKMAEAMRKLGTWTIVMLTMIFTIIMISMFLVTLVIERNTRRAE